MYLKTIEIENYKCFWKPQKIQLEHGFNLFVGTNNSGKTTVLEALDLTLLNEPHRSFSNLPEYGAQSRGTSRIVTTLTTDINELRRVCGNQLYIPLPITCVDSLTNTPETVTEIIGRLISQPNINVTLELNQSNGGIPSFIIECFLGHSPRFLLNGNSVFSLALTYNDDSSPVGIIAMCSTGGPIWALHDRLRPYVYRFSAQRRPAGASGAGAAQLDREATNLPYCINYLQSNDAHGHRMLCEWINRVFPDVKWVQAPPNGGSFELTCLPLPPEARRNDLAIPLSRMGSGIGNVIAMLYVVLTSRHPQVIAIDEPNSFLHPRALRELLQILSIEGKQHQFILTAHSADVLTAVNPNLITLFEFDGACTTIRQVDGKDITSLRGNLAELGIRMTDLHGRDRVLWVEGQTEEIVMPELLRYFCPEIAAGIAVLRVEYTGTFEKKGVDPIEVAKLYKRLTESSALVPPMAAILLDAEKRDPAACKRLENSSDGVLRFLERRMLENYLLVPEAVSMALNDLGEEVTVEQVRAALIGAIGANALDRLHGADVLGKVFSELSHARYEFKKTRDIPQIVTWLLSNRPEELKNLGVFLRRLFGLSCSSTGEEVGGQAKQ